MDTSKLRQSWASEGFSELEQLVAIGLVRDDAMPSVEAADVLTFALAARQIIDSDFAARYSAKLKDQEDAVFMRAYQRVSGEIAGDTKQLVGAVDRVDDRLKERTQIGYQILWGIVAGTFVWLVQTLLSFVYDPGA